MPEQLVQHISGSWTEKCAHNTLVVTGCNPSVQKVPSRLSCGGESGRCDTVVGKVFISGGGGRRSGSG